MRRRGSLPNGRVHCGTSRCEAAVAGELYLIIIMMSFMIIIIFYRRESVLLYLGVLASKAPRISD